jgi:hypothetical protein
MFECRPVFFELARRLHKLVCPQGCCISSTPHGGSQDNDNLEEGRSLIGERNADYLALSSSSGKCSCQRCSQPLPDNVSSSVPLELRQIIAEDLRDHFHRFGPHLEPEAELHSHQTMSSSPTTAMVTKQNDVSVSPSTGSLDPPTQHQLQLQQGSNQFTTRPSSAQPSEQPCIGTLSSNKIDDVDGNDSSTETHLNSDYDEQSASPVHIYREETAMDYNETSFDATEQRNPPQLPIPHPEPYPHYKEISPYPLVSARNRGEGIENSTGRMKVERDSEGDHCQHVMSTPKQSMSEPIQRRHSSSTYVRTPLSGIIMHRSPTTHNNATPHTCPALFHAKSRRYLQSDEIGDDENFHTYASVSSPISPAATHEDITAEA